MANYTTPTVNYGRLCKTKTQQTQTRWCVEFTIDNTRKRVSRNLNKIKTYHEKFQAFQKLRDDIESELKQGVYDKPLIHETPTLLPTIKDATIAFMQWHLSKGSRQKTVQSYQSKLNYLVNSLGDTKVNDTYHKELNDVLLDLSNNLKWSPKTFNNAKLIYYGLFQFCIESRWIEHNPMARIKSLYVPKSNRNKAFSKQDFHKILEYIEKDKMLSMFIKSIYFTAIRPRELVSLQIHHIDFKKRTIFIPSSISKNKKDGYVHIDDAYYQLLQQYYGDAPQDAFLFCNDDHLWGYESYHPNRPYKRLVTALDKLGMSTKGYTLYSVKHYSNVQKFLGGWTVAEIMKANRHASIEETENYLRDLLDYVDITKKAVPAI